MLVGRDRELAELDGALDRLASGAGALFLLLGEPGIGKTRLAAEAAERARARGVGSAWGRCWEAGGAPAYWPWREALETLGIQFPDPKAIAENTPAEARFALFREVLAALARRSAISPSLLVLEDLHAADNSTLLLLDFVARQLHGLPLVLVGTYRDLEASLLPETSDALSRIGRHASVHALARLRGEEVATLVKEAISAADERVAAEVYETTLGNPLFVQEMVRDLRAHGSGRGNIPLGVREIIRQRLGLVSERARRVLEAGAVLGVEFSASHAARMVEGARAVLDDAERSGLVTARGDRLRFSHALYREALYHDLPRARRETLHREAATALEAGGAPAVEIAHQLLEAGADSATDAVDVCIRAAQNALDVFAFEDARALLERAREAIPPGPLELVLRCRLSIALGEARIRSGDASGRELSVEAARTARELGDAELLARAGLAYGSVFVMGGVDAVLVGMLEEALAGLATSDGPLRARVMARLAAARQPSPPDLRPRDIQLAFDAIAMARRCAERRDLMDVLHSASGALYGAADPALRLGISKEQERLAEELGDVARLLAARVRLATDHLELADFAAYDKLADSYAELAERLGRAAAPWRAALMRSMLALATDRFDDSLRHQARAREIEAEHPRALRAQALHRIAFLRAAERHGELVASIPELRGLWLGMPYGTMLADARVASCLARVGAGDEVRTILDRLPEEVFREQINCAALSEAVWLAGSREQAELLYPVVAAMGTRWQIYWLDCEIVEGPNERALAYLAGLLGRWDECDRLFSRALQSVESVGRRALAARMRFELGDLLVRAGKQRERAARLLAEARESAQALGLPELAALIERRHPALDGATIAPALESFSMLLEGEYFSLRSGSRTLRFKATRGMRYLARLIEQPGVDLHVLDLAGSADVPDRGDAGELVDGRALRDYRARLEALRDAAEDADALGDGERAARAREEMEAIARELGRSAGRGGRPRRGESAVDRARSAVQRRIKDALDRIAEQDPELGAWLRKSVNTGNYCSFRP